MTAPAIRDVFAWEALDSRGKPTVGCTVELEDGSHGRTVVPSGASTGGYEARELRDGGDRYHGAGVRRAVENVNSRIRNLLIGRDATDQAAVDSALEGLDGEEALGNIGANAVLAASLSVLQAAASLRSIPLWRHLSTGPPLMPMPMVNVFSGGAHARGLIDIQDVLVIPIGAASFRQAIEWAARVRFAASELLDDRGGSAALVADEGGIAGALESNRAALALVADAIIRSGLRIERDVVLAVDLAANQLWRGADYRLRTESVVLSADDWLKRVDSWCAEFPIASVEDILFEDDWAGWTNASRVHCTQRQLLGDDLFATNASRLNRGIEAGVANAVLVKPNQAGSVTRAERVMELAHANNYGTVVSARSGDTEDTWLADFAVGWRSGQIKVGSTMRSERTAKWNRLLEIESRAAGSATFAGRDALPTLS